MFLTGRGEVEEVSDWKIPKRLTISTRPASHRRRPTKSTLHTGLRSERRKRNPRTIARTKNDINSVKKRLVRSNDEPRKTGRTRHPTTPDWDAKAAKQTGPRGSERGATRRKREMQRSSEVLSRIFRSPKPSPPEKRVTCLTCLSDDVPINRSAKLACSHRMCHSCLKRIFTLSVHDPQHMPPRCCTSDHIPPKHVDKLFDMKFKMKWNRKYQEFTTRNRIYCPAKGCGEWIKPGQMSSGFGIGFGSNGDRGKSAKCSRCRTKICCACKGRWHVSKTCPDDEDTKKFVSMAQQKGWQRCYNCAAIVELKEGCNHMTCRCTAEFCMICGSRWKTCDCPWFNYTLEEDDQLNYMNLPRLTVNMADNLNGMPRANDMPRRRGQIQLPEDFFRRFQLLDLGQDNHSPTAEHDDHHLLLFGNANDHVLNEHFIPQRHERRS